MLFVLTGDVQTGKTRWLQALVSEIEQSGGGACGVLAPGVWADRRDEPERGPQVDANGFEKTGIDNVLLPQHERICFAQRADLAARDNVYDGNAQSARAGLGWHISDEALGRVNAHLASLARPTSQVTLPERALADSSAHAHARLLVIDELGRLELEFSRGLTQAVAILENGPGAHAAHALVVVREALLPHLRGRFLRWGERAIICPTDDARTHVLATLGLR